MILRSRLRAKRDRAVKSLRGFSYVERAAISADLVNYRAKKVASAVKLRDYARNRISMPLLFFTANSNGVVSDE